MATLYMDVHVPRLITEGLRRRGIDVLTAQEDEATEFDDPDLLRRTTELNRVLLTQDQDFLQIAAEWQENGIAFRAIIHAHPLHAGIGEIILDTELILTAAEDEELWNRVIHLPLR